LRLRLLLAAAISVLAALALSAFGLTLLFERHVERRVDAELGVFLDQVVAGLDRAADGSLVLTQAPADPRFEEPLSGLYWQLRAGDAVLASRSLWDATLALPPDELPDRAVHRHRIAGPGGAELLVLERSVTLPGRLGGGILRAAVAADAAEIAAATRAFAVDLLPYIGVLAVFLIAAAYAQVAVGLRPLAAVRRRLADIRDGRQRRLGQAFPDEIQPLAGEVDDLLEARERQAEKARARAGDLAHGLKTPLQVLAGSVDRLRAKGEDEVAQDIALVAGSMRRHVERELARARMAAAAPDATADVARVVERLVAVVGRTPAGSRLDWAVEIPAGTGARIDADDLAEALGNLIENAARHAHRRVAIGAREAAGLTVVTVTDDGGGIPPERLDEALRRGGRLDNLGSGAGLGLAIVQDVAEAWGGRLRLRNGAAGLEAEFSLPAAPPPRASSA
ncbi:MAG TPA: HAMP domain-containing sensor histidine kinase, partial [Kiloniellaceae bacterium]|nr:HAMP domain-containing sensor histidine kinase [Kiloniellaceae bacterium]